MAAAWNDGLFLGSYLLADGRAVVIVHRGSWTHGFGPDFRDAMISIDGKDLQSGSVELHLRTSGWRAHGHHLDPRYNDVIAHVVQIDDGAETRRLDGKLVPVLTLPAGLVERVQPRQVVDWSLVGGSVCAEKLTKDQPNVVKAIVLQLGDARLAGKTARLESLLMTTPPAELLYQEIWDGLGFSANREPMRALSRMLRLSTIESLLATVQPDDRLSACRGLLFGAAGFLPISPADANAARWSPEESAAAESAWQRLGGAWHDAALPATTWTRARVRPANHPALRLSAGASMLASAIAGLSATLLEAVRRREDVAQLIRDLSQSDLVAPVGSDRAIGIVANAIVPFAFALSESTGDLELGEAAAESWERLPPAEANEVTRRALHQVAGASRLSALGARGQQGLIHLDQTLCAPRRCFECPIAQLVLANY